MTDEPKNKTADEPKPERARRFTRRPVQPVNLPLSQARELLEENATRIDREKQPVLWNINAAAVSLCDVLAGLRDDMEGIHRRFDQLIAELKTTKRR